jgi:acid phosphatase (class A)
MIRLKTCAWFLLAIAMAASSLTAQAKDEQSGYLAPNAVDILKILPPAPQKGDARYDADRAIFKATRRFVGSPRWILATNDVQLSPATLMHDFSCSLGVSLTPETAPKLVHLMEIAGKDTSRAANVAKDHFQRLRPFQIDEGDICQPSIELANSFDYPSGHTTRGWTWAALLAELVPENAGAIFERGRAYGESRIVCGAHNASAVESGRLTAGSILAVAHSSPAFQTDLKAAKEELDALRADAMTPRPQNCAAETELLGIPVF